MKSKYDWADLLAQGKVGSGRDLSFSDFVHDVQCDAREPDYWVGSVPNTIVLMYIMGWQGGTVAQVAEKLNVPPDFIVNASLEVMGALMRAAQKVRNGNR